MKKILILFAILVVGVACEKDDSYIEIVEQTQEGSIGLEDIGIVIGKDTFGSTSGKIDNPVYKGGLTLMIRNRETNEVFQGQIAFTGTASDVTETLERTRLTGIPYGDYDVVLTVVGQTQELDYSLLELVELPDGTLDYDKIITVDSPLTPVHARFQPASAHLEVIVNTNEYVKEYALTHTTGYYVPGDAMVTLTVTSTTDQVFSASSSEFEMLKGHAYTVIFDALLTLDMLKLGQVYIAATIDGYQDGITVTTSAISEVVESTGSGMHAYQAYGDDYSMYFTGTNVMETGDVFFFKSDNMEYTVTGITDRGTWTEVHTTFKFPDAVSKSKYNGEEAFIKK